MIFHNILHFVSFMGIPMSFIFTFCTPYTELRCSSIIRNSFSSPHTGVPNKFIFCIFQQDVLLKDIQQRDVKIS